MNPLMNPDPACPPYVIGIFLGICFIAVMVDVFKK
jgi:hypothetical protein